MSAADTKLVQIHPPTHPTQAVFLLPVDQRPKGEVDPITAWGEGIDYFGVTTDGDLVPVLLNEDGSWSVATELDGFLGLDFVADGARDYGQAEVAARWPKSGVVDPSGKKPDDRAQRKSRRRKAR